MESREFVNKYSREFDSRGYRAGTKGTDLFRDCIVYLATYYRLQIEGHTEDRMDEMRKMNKKYNDEMIDFFRGFAAELARALDEKPHDYLGELFQSIGANSSSLGQFFTPTSVSTLMSEMMVGSMDFDTPRETPYTFNDPTCGSGSMLIGTINVLKNKNVNYAFDTMMYATDIDKIACYMCYLQLNLLGAAAIISHGNTLTMEMGDTMPTLAAIGQKYLRSLTITVEEEAS